MSKRYHVARIMLVCFVLGILTISLSSRVVSVSNGFDGGFVNSAMAEGDDGDGHDSGGDDGAGHDGEGHDGDGHDGDGEDGAGHDGEGDGGDGHESQTGGAVPTYKAKPTVRQY